MTIKKKYFCGICETTPDQISHHKSHLSTQKHNDKKEIFKIKLTLLKKGELKKNYGTNSIEDIVKETETVVSTISDKKLNSNYIVDKKSGNYKMSLVKNFSQDNYVSNKEALRDKIHEIHNFLRNNGAGYGMNALKVFNVIFGLKKIEENDLFDIVDLKNKKCKFSYLLKKAKKNEHELLAELVFGVVLDSIAVSKVRELLFYEIPKKIKGSVLTYLIKEIDNITKIEKSCNVLLSGKIYEYFIGRDESAISELGAYFTDRHIVDYILEKLNPELNEDKTVPTMIDMFGGSGGFTTGYIGYMKNKYGDKIDWTTEINKISHYDMNEDVIKSAGLEFFCLTGVLPDMRNYLTYKNSFSDSFGNRKYKYPLTNPPYGGDKNITTDGQNKERKIKEYIKRELTCDLDKATRIRRQKQLKRIETKYKQDVEEIKNRKVNLDTCSDRINDFAKKYKLKGNDKEACSLILLMDIVDYGGTAIGVLKEGVFFNKTYKDIRKCLVENFNVREVISVPQDQFENTSTKTSIIIFDNIDKKTSSVKFRNLIVERYDEDKFEEVLGDILLVENKGDIKCVKDELLCKASLEDILNNPIYSLNGKDYNKKVIVVGKGYKLVKLGDICEFQPKSKRKASYGKVEGKYNFYTSSDKVKKCDVVDYDEECLIIGDGGVANIQMDDKFSCSDHNYIIKTKYNKYIYNLLKGSIDLLSDGFTGSVIKNLSKDYLNNLQIPIPKSDKKMKKWVDKISKPYDEKNEKEKKIKELEQFIKNRIQEISDNEECDELKFDDILQYVNKKNKYRATDGKNEGKYRFYTSSQDKILYRDDYEFGNTNILIGRGGVASLHLTSNFSVSHDDVYVLTTKTTEFNLIYIYHYIRSNIKLIEDSFKGSTIKHSSKTSLSKIKLKIPKNKQLIQDLEPTFQKIETLQNEVKEAEKLYKQLIQELKEEAIIDDNKKQIIEDKLSDNKKYKSNKKYKKDVLDRDDHKKINLYDDKSDDDYSDNITDEMEDNDSMKKYKQKKDKSKKDLKMKIKKIKKDKITQKTK